MLKARERKDVYIVEKIIKYFNEFVLFLTMRYNFASSINTDIVFLSVNNIFKFAFTDSINVNTDLTNIANELTVVDEINYSQSLIKIYKL